jgi:hypothetical protein
MNLKKIIQECINEIIDKNVYYHGSSDIKLSGKNGIHIGTKLAATQALESRIGVPAEGEWDGKRIYGNTLLAGEKRLKELEKERGYYLTTGYNTRNVPEDNYYPSERNESAKYSDGTLIPLDSKPIIFPVRIIGNMKNLPFKPYKDITANNKILKDIKNGEFNHGYYYINDGEDVGSISAVVPDKSFLEILNK